MKTYCSTNYKTEAPTVCALGCFDGIHIGHAFIIKKAREVADQNSTLCAVWSFAEPPKNYFLKEEEKIPLLTTATEKQKEMEHFTLQQNKIILNRKDIYI